MPKHYLSTDEKRAFMQRTLDNIREHLGKTTKVVLLPSNMAAGPCEAVRRAAEQEYFVTDAPLTPLDGCSHPDQCGCLVSVRSFDD